MVLYLHTVTRHDVTPVTVLKDLAEAYFFILSYNISQLDLARPSSWVFTYRAENFSSASCVSIQTVWNLHGRLYNGISQAFITTFRKSILPNDLYILQTATRLFYLQLNM